MSMRISEQIAGTGLLCLALVGCDQGEGAQSPFANSASEKRALADCAIGADAKWARICAVEQDGELLIIRHPDGGFRRFHILDDRRGLASADGAEPAKIAVISDAVIEVSAGQDHYRLPATVTPATMP